MESEKVKEIKKALECNADYEHYDKLSYIDGYKCKLVAYRDILTLINELESENENLSAIVKAQKYCVTPKHCLEVKALKDRIAELENTDYYKKIEKKKEELLCKEYGLIKYEKEIVGKYLKQFTERLKEKFNDTEYRAKTKRKTISVEELKAQMDWILHEVVSKNIDETLKEFI